MTGASLLSVSHREADVPCCASRTKALCLPTRCAGTACRAPTERLDLMLFGYSAGYVDDRQDRKDEGLQYGYENMKQDEWDRTDQRNYYSNVSCSVQVLE